jgi:hypothetical protein
MSSQLLTHALKDEELAVAAIMVAKPLLIILAHHRAAHASKAKIRALTKHVIGLNI